ncbi:hypothetical protein VTL71DRAFT_3279 [Oculimacula yallundae]|uniref:Uncharacterized protein n=1 Tax=Oculimacula yallundae TaxID=86028 RepID=A0ABR4C6S3_9HELO
MITPIDELSVTVLPFTELYRFPQASANSTKYRWSIYKASRSLDDSLYYLLRRFSQILQVNNKEQVNMQFFKLATAIAILPTFVVIAMPVAQPDINIQITFSVRASLYSLAMSKRRDKLSNSDMHRMETQFQEMTPPLHKAEPGVLLTLGARTGTEFLVVANGKVNAPKRRFLAAKARNIITAVMGRILAPAIRYWGYGHPIPRSSVSGVLYSKTVISIIQTNIVLHVREPTHEQGALISEMDVITEESLGKSH